MNNAFAPRKADSTVSLLDAYMVPCLRLCVSTLLLLVIGGLIGADAEAAADCGKLNQKACKVTLLRLKACDWGLHKDKSSGRKALRSAAKALLTLLRTNLVSVQKPEPFIRATIITSYAKQRILTIRFSMLKMAF